MKNESWLDKITNYMKFKIAVVSIILIILIVALIIKVIAKV